MTKLSGAASGGIGKLMAVGHAITSAMISVRKKLNMSDELNFIPKERSRITLSEKEMQSSEQKLTAIQRAQLKREAKALKKAEQQRKIDEAKKKSI